MPAGFILGAKKSLLEFVAIVASDLILNPLSCYFEQIIRMSELYAYQNKGWRPEIYTLTNLDLHCKAVPGMLELVHPFFEQLMGDMHELFPGDCKPATTRYRNDNEPHLVKYMGSHHSGVCMHTDRRVARLVPLSVRVNQVPP